MKYRTIMLAGLLLAAAAATLAAEPRYYSVGIKLGHTFGKQGGFTYGGEFSYITWPSDGKGLPLGYVIDLDGNKDHVKLHFGVEAAWLAGVDIGPTVVFRGPRRELGLTVTPYLWAVFAMPYYSHTFLPGPGLNEVGTYIKWTKTIEPVDFHF